MLCFKPVPSTTSAISGDVVKLADFRKTIRRVASKSTVKAFSPAVAPVESALRALHCVQGADVGEKLAKVAKLITACDDFTRAGAPCPMQQLVKVVKYQAFAEAKELLATRFAAISRTRGLRGWPRVRAAIQPIVAGARRRPLHLSPHYWQEALMEHHLPASIGHDNPQAIWARSDTRHGFVDWMREQYIPHLQDSKVLAKLCERYSRSVYYGTDEDRAKWRLHAAGGLLYDVDGMPFDTANMRGWLGEGYAAFARTTTGELVAHSHEVAAFHHSSLAGGRPVLAVGDFMVRQGRILQLVSKSGHYRPSCRSMAMFIIWLKSLGVDLGGAIVCLYPHKPVQWLRVAEVLDAKEFVQEIVQQA